MASIDGKTILVQSGGVTIVGQVSGSLGMTGDMLDATTKDSTAGAKEYIGGETGWTISVEGLYDPAAGEQTNDAIDDLQAGTQVVLKYGVLAGTYWTGNGYISSVNLDGPKNDLASYSLEIQGDGVLAEV